MVTQVRKLDDLKQELLIRFNARSANLKEKLGSLKKLHPELKIADTLNQQLRELFLLRNPSARFKKDGEVEFKKFLAKINKEEGNDDSGNWFYFPWSNFLIRYLPENFHQELRSGRNVYLITKKEQKKYYRAKIGILGMSVGSHVALTIAMTGGAKSMKLADPDVISGDNLNRIRAGFSQVGQKKVVSVMRQIVEINPYADVEVFPEGLTENNLEQFLAGGGRRLDLLVEEMDNPYLKLKVRFKARKLRIPVIMAADNGDGIIVDVERYDLDEKPPILHGILGNVKPEDFKSVPRKELPRIIAKMAGADLATIRMLESVLEVGKTIYSWPQLGTAATLCGSVLAFLARRITLKDDRIKSGRYEVNPEYVFEDDYFSKKKNRDREQKRKKLLAKLFRAS